MSDSTQELPAVTGEEERADEPLDDEEEAWLAPPQPRGIRVAVPTLVLLVLVAAAGAFWGGAVVQKHNGGSTTSAASALARLRQAGAGAAVGGANGGAGSSGFRRAAPTASGILTDVAGTTIYLTDSSGALVKVTLTPSTTVTRTGDGQAGAITVGDTVTVQGTKAADGTVTATSVVATAPGVRTTGGGSFGGG